MSIIAELTIPTSEFALGQTLQAIPDITVEFERVVTHSQEWVMPFLWVKTDDMETVHREITADPTVEEATVADQFDGVVLYQIRWSAEIRELINAIFDQSGVLIEGTANASNWDILVQFDNHQSLGKIKEYFQPGRTAFTLERLYSPETPREVEFNLTAAQRDTLVMAIERGFFEVPRETTLEDLASELDITSTAVSERLRRAICTLGKNALSIEDEIE
ncbi:helix-turn-helix domain-containing protein [Halostella litorea]|uniref:helix-turn-helix domain-containing protein n=1 Tax=Halostella litorea TaxID=2528831 RepID=UPI0010930254|nr:helix-turn-helix domain-containing protein [Halostella litorea]